MNDKFFNDLKQTGQTWSPAQADLDVMLSKAHQRAKDIHSFRRRSLSLAIITLSVGLLSFIMLPAPEAPSQKPSPIVSVHKTQSASNVIQSTKTVYSKEERQLMLAVAEANSFHNDDFDFISEALTSSWSDLLSDN